MEIPLLTFIFKRYLSNFQTESFFHMIWPFNYTLIRICICGGIGSGYCHWCWYVINRRWWWWWWHLLQCGQCIRLCEQQVEWSFKPFWNFSKKVKSYESAVSFISPNNKFIPRIKRVQYVRRTFTYWQYNASVYSSLKKYIYCICINM